MQVLHIGGAVMLFGHGIIVVRSGQCMAVGHNYGLVPCQQVLHPTSSTSEQ